MTDTALEREIERALAVDPSPDFLARVRTRIASEPAASGWRFSWTLLAVASAVVVMVAAADVIVRQPGVQRSGPQESALIEARPIGEAFVPLAPAGARPALDALLPHSPAATRKVVRAPAEPEVLIAKDESAALRRLMRGMPRGVVVDPSTPGDGLSGIEAMQPPKAIVFAPVAEISRIAIERLGAAVPEKGGRQ